MLKKVFDFFEIKPDLTIARNDVNYYQYYNYYDIKKMMEVFFRCNRDMFFNCIDNTVPSNAYKNSYLPTNEDIKSSLKEDLESFKKFYEDKVLSNIYCYLMDQNFRKIQNNYLAKNENNYPSTNLTKEIVAKCDLLLNKFANTNSKIFSVFHNYSGDYDYDSLLLIGMDQLNLLRDNSRDELKNLTYFFDTKYIKNNDYIPVQPYEYNCYIHFNKAIYFFKINDKSNLEKLIINNLSKILLSKIKSQNQFIKLDFHKKIESDVYIFGIPENVNNDFNNFVIFN